MESEQSRKEKTCGNNNPNKTTRKGMRRHVQVEITEENKNTLFISFLFCLVQECNSYALGVWKRVNMKLDGRVDPAKPMSVQDQVRCPASSFIC